MTPTLFKAFPKQCYRTEKKVYYFQLLRGTYYCFIIFNEKCCQVGENSCGGLKLSQQVSSSPCMAYKILVATTPPQCIFLENFHINYFYHGNIEKDLIGPADELHVSLYRKNSCMNHS